MTEPICEWCPFVRDCDVCMFSGGEAETLEPQANRDAEVPENDARNGKVSLGNKTAPDSASTLPRPRPTGAAKPHGRTCIT